MNGAQGQGAAPTGAFPATATTATSGPPQTPMSQEPAHSQNSADDESPADPLMMAGANGSSSLAKKRKKDGLKPIITTEGPAPTSYATKVDLPSLGFDSLPFLASATKELVGPVTAMHVFALQRLCAIRQAEMCLRLACIVHCLSSNTGQSAAHSEPQVGIGIEQALAGLSDTGPETVQSASKLCPLMRGKKAQRTGALPKGEPPIE
ncbi:hypothetical protein BX600DRAFT_442860 [Xylariales sp. PMI_506]|nr:hypothetical protein BX600DRAFT_442860 [Xylariales sp. PMI_506]